MHLLEHSLSLLHLCPKRKRGRLSGLHIIILIFFAFFIHMPSGHDPQSPVQGTAPRGRLSAALVKRLHISPAPALALGARGVLTATGRAAVPTGSFSPLRAQNQGKESARGREGTRAFDSGPSYLLHVELGDV